MMELKEAELKEVNELKELVLQQGSNVLGVQSRLLEIEKNMGKKDNKDELELKIIELEEKILLLEKEVKNVKFASLKQIIQQKDELIVSLQGTITRNYEEMLTIRQNINQANMKTNGIIQSIGMKLNEVDQDFGQKIQGLDQAMRKTDNKCKDLENKITK
uniref:Uncharacterized protein n=1 Tax=Meloidogyne javanica TaxID=6303 RepID=A0A915LRY0_MELJA